MIPDVSELERFFAQWEFSVEHLLCASDIEALTLHELVELADGESRELWERLTLGYTETAGHPRLRSTIAELYDKVEPDDVVVCGGGAVEAIFLLLNATLEPGGHCVVVWPAFESLTKVAPAIGARATTVPLSAANGWQLDVDAVRRALQPDTRVVIVNYPHNPTGALLDSAAWRELVELVEERGIRLLSDEVYRYTEFDPATRLPAAADLGDRAASVGVMSKAYALAGLRIGWIASHDRELLRRVVAIKDYTSVCCSAPAEVLALMALRARDRVIARSRAIVAENLAHVDAFFARWPEVFSWVRPVAGVVGYPRLSDRWPVDGFVDDLVHRHGVLLLPGRVFSDTGNRFRIGLGRRGLPQALDRLDTFVQERLSQ